MLGDSQIFHATAGERLHPRIAHVERDERTGVLADPIGERREDSARDGIDGRGASG